MTLPDEPAPSDNHTSADETTDEIQDMLGEEDYIPGTRIPKPRNRGVYESEEEYVEFLRQYYAENFPKHRYLETLLQYVNNNNTTIYDYYVEVANHYRRHEESSIPEFERDNPFVNDEELILLIDSDDVRMPLYFAGTLSKVVEKNLPQYIVDQSKHVFVDPVEKYSEEVGKLI